LEQIVAALGPRRKAQLPGYRTRIIDGNHLASTDHRLKPLRTTRSGPLPGQALAVLDPDRMLIIDLFPCEDGEAQERRMLPEVIPAARERDLWIADRNPQVRSEEHTSELQSHLNLVCRLLLEKKKKRNQKVTYI